MRNVLFPILFFVFLFPLQAYAAGQTYIIDPDQTHVRFAAKMCEADLLMGEFADVQGNIYFDENDVTSSRVNVIIDAASASFNKEYHHDDHIETIVEGEKFLNTGIFPKITFESLEVERTGDFTGKIKGLMSLVGVKRPFSLDVTFHEDAGKTKSGREFVSFSAEGKFKRSDFGILYALDRVGIRRIGDEVTVLLTVTANKEEEGTDK